MNTPPKILLPYFNDENVKKYLKTPDKIFGEKLDAEMFKLQLSKYFNIHRENIILKHVCKELSDNFGNLKNLSDTTNLSEREFIEMLVKCFVDMIDVDAKKIICHAYRKYNKKFNIKK
jgi:hypothetical protein